MKFLSFVSRGLICLLIGFLSLASLQGAVTGYIKIGDIKGESQAAGHVEEIDFFAVAWAMNRSIPEGAKDAQRTRGDTTLGDVVITRELDKASPKLMEACAGGTFFSEVILTVEKTVAGAQVDYLKITMTDVIITSVSTGGSGGEDRLTENVSLNCTSAEIVFTVFNEDGSLAGNVIGDVQQTSGTP